MAETDPLVEGADNQEADARPDWLPENFKSPEDLARSYTEAQRKITELSTQNKGLEESIGELSAQFNEFVTVQNQPDPADVEAQWLNAYEQNPISTMQELARITAENVAKQYAQQNQQPAVAPDVIAFMADQNMAAQHEDWAGYKQQVVEFIQSNPLYANDQLWQNPAAATQALDSAYKMVKAESVLSGNDVVQQQLDATRQMKLNAQSATGAGGRPDSPDVQQARWQEIMNAQTGKLDF